MNHTDTTRELPPPSPERAKRLLRSRDDRVIAGVAGGLGQYFDIDPVIVRIAFAISIFFGGLGAVAYVAMALFVPTAGAAPGEVEPAPIERSRGLAIAVGVGVVVIALSWGIFDGPFWDAGSWVGAVLIVAAVAAGAVTLVRRTDAPRRARGAFATAVLATTAFVGLALVAVASAWAAATGHGAVIAATAIGLGALLVVMAFRGGARWLIAPALALAIPLGAVAAADVSFGDSIGEREYRPLSRAALPTSYELGIGRLAVDLRQLDWTDSTAVDLDLDLGVGEAVVVVPSRVCVTTDFDTRAGALRVAGDEASGTDVHSAANAGATATPRLHLTGEVDLGDLQVINDDDADIDGRGPGFQYGPNRERMAAAEAAACADPRSRPSAEKAGGSQRRPSSGGSRGSGGR